MDPSEYRLSRADQHFDELSEIMNPESVQLLQAILSYLGSVEFFFLVFLFLAYRLVRK
jgi:hypothetical protein